MKFEPKTPGNFDEYEYAGTGEDVGAGFFGEGNFPLKPVVDSAGDLYVIDEIHIEKYDPVAVIVEPDLRSEIEEGGIDLDDRQPSYW